MGKFLFLFKSMDKACEELLPVNSEILKDRETRKMLIQLIKYRSHYHRLINHLVFEVQSTYNPFSSV